MSAAIDCAHPLRSQCEVACGCPTGETCDCGAANCHAPRLAMYEMPAVADRRVALRDYLLADGQTKSAKAVDTCIGRHNECRTCAFWAHQYLDDCDDDECCICTGDEAP